MHVHLARLLAPCVHCCGHVEAEFTPDVRCHVFTYSTYAINAVLAVSVWVAWYVTVWDGTVDRYMA